MKTSSVARWMFTHGMYVTGTSSPGGSVVNPEVAQAKMNRANYP
jgi:hypothetical protein